MAAIAFNFYHHEYQIIHNHKNTELTTMGFMSRYFLLTATILILNRFPFLPAVFKANFDYFDCSKHNTSYRYQYDQTYLIL